jgi:hypothetical protein
MLMKRALAIVLLVLILLLLLPPVAMGTMDLCPACPPAHGTSGWALCFIALAGLLLLLLPSGLLTRQARGAPLPIPLFPSGVDRPPQPH